MPAKKTESTLRPRKSAENTFSFLRKLLRRILFPIVFQYSTCEHLSFRIILSVIGLTDALTEANSIGNGGRANEKSGKIKLNKSMLL